MAAALVFSLEKDVQDFIEKAVKDCTSLRLELTARANVLEV